MLCSFCCLPLAFDPSKPYQSLLLEINVQREILSNPAFEVGYVGNRGLKALGTHFLNEIEPELAPPRVSARS